MWDEPAAGTHPAPATAGTGTTTTTQFPAGGEHDWTIGPTTTTKDWGADEGGEWNNTDTTVMAYFITLCIYLLVFYRLIGDRLVFDKFAFFGHE